MKIKLYIVLLTIHLATPLLRAQWFPLSENSWSNPEFVKRFTGSYGFDTAVTPSITSVEQALFEALAPLVESNPEAAIAKIRDSLGPDSNPALFYTLANLYLQTSQLEEARNNYEKAILAFPNFLRAYKNLGVLHIQNGDFNDAIPMLLKALQLGGIGEDVYGLIGYAYLNVGNSVAALAAYEQALFFAPKSRDWRMGKVQALSNLGRHKETIALVDELLEDFPRQTELLLLQANAFIAIGDSESAAATLEIVHGRGTGDANSLMLLGDIYLSFQQAEMALDIYRTAIEDKALTTERCLGVARRLASSNAWPQLDAFLDILRVRFSTDGSPSQAERIDFLNLMAQSDLAQNRTASAAESLTEVVNLDPLNGRALLLLANYYWAEQDHERAEIYYERATRIEEVAPEALVHHARMLVSIREFRKAIPLLERAQRLRHQSHVGQFLDKVVSAASATGR